MKKIKIVSDGTQRGTQILDSETGELISGVSKITWSIAYNSPRAKVVIEFTESTVMAELQGELDFINSKIAKK